MASGASGCYTAAAAVERSAGAALIEGLEPPSGAQAIGVGLSAVVVAVTDDEPRVLVVRAGGDVPEALPAGPLQARHRTLEAGLRSWVEQLTGQTLGYVEQLYTFGDLNRHGHEPGTSRTLSIGYLALVREARPAGSYGADWHSWYRYFPWEDWRNGRPAIVDEIEPRLLDWAAAAPDAAERQRRVERLGVAIGAWRSRVERGAGPGALRAALRARPGARSAP